VEKDKQTYNNSLLVRKQKQKDAEKEEKTGDDSESGPAGDTPATEKKHAE
jgi:hypothetical protein